MHVPLGLSVYLSCLLREAFCHCKCSEHALCICGTSLVVIERSMTVIIKTSSILLSAVVAIQGKDEDDIKRKTVPQQLFALTAWHDGDSWLLSGPK